MAMAFVSIVTPPFDAQYAARSFIATSPSTEPIFTMVPPPHFRNSGSAAGVSKMRRRNHREYWLGAWARGDEGSRSVLCVERRSNNADEGHGHRSWAREHTRKL